MSYVSVSVTRPSKKNVGAGGDKKDMLILFRKDDVLVMPDRDSKGVRITDDIQMKPGAYMIEVYGTLSSISKGFTSEGDPDAAGFMHNFSFTHPGDELEVSEFTQNWLNEDILAITRKCSTNEKRLLGTECAPLRMSVEATDNNELNNSVFTFASLQKAQAVPAHYEGSLTLPQPVGVFTAADSTPSVAAGEGEYQAVGDSAAQTITTLDDAVDGALYTILGITSGTNAPVISAGDDFLLKSGATFTANGGTRITFRAFKDGASTFKFIEVSRS